MLQVLLPQHPVVGLAKQAVARKGGGWPCHSSVATPSHPEGCPILRGDEY